MCTRARDRRERALLDLAMWAVFAEPDLAFMRELYRPAIDEIGAINAAASDLLEGIEANALSSLDFPSAHQRRQWSSNTQERMNREIKKRPNVVQVLPSRKSLIRLLDAVPSETDEERPSQR